PDEARGRCGDILSQAGGVFPNFFGIQRFGSLRPITHRVGEMMVRDRWKEAVKVFLGEVGYAEGEEARARGLVSGAAEGDAGWDAVLSSFPKSLYLERRVLEALAEGRSYRESLSRLPFHLLQLFVHSFEAYLFNRILSERMGRELPLSSPVEGDLLIPSVAQYKGGRRRFIPVSGRNISRAEEMVGKGKAWVSCLVPGVDGVFAEGEQGEIEHRILEEENVCPEDFFVREMPRLTSRGTRRPAHMTVDDMIFLPIKDPLGEGLEFTFSLPPGSYATTVLREFMKKNDPLSY
ncbi:MAG: tRNA pseudouridine(13) synthase TruD, partial [Thermoplasmata archaeon]|nr:tRNA pseudouridine(13) synthase TruD [Thermoplasmata archaeon]